MGCLGEGILVEREKVLACKGTTNVFVGLEKGAENERGSWKLYSHQYWRWQ